MDTEILSGTLPTSESPGLESFDPRMGEITGLVQSGEFLESARQVEQLINEEIYDIRLVGYFYFGIYLEQGLGALAAVFDSLTHTLAENWEAFGPLKQREKAAQSGIGWLFKQLSRNFERTERTKGETWDGWVAQLTTEDVDRTLEAADALRVALGGSLGDEAAPVLDNLARLRDWLQGFRGAVPDPPSLDSDEEQDLDDELVEEASEPDPPALATQVAPAGSSPQMAQLLKKLAVFEQLVQRGEMFRAKVVADDVTGLLQSFDPLLYLPEVFSTYLRLCAENIDSLVQFDPTKGSPQWRAAEQFYRVDVDGFAATDLPVPSGEYSAPEEGHGGGGDGDSDEGGYEEEASYDDDDDY
jgi:hypothetical protein